MPEPKERLWNFHLSDVKKNGVCTLKAIEWECPISMIYGVKGGYLAELAKVNTVEEISLDHKFSLRLRGEK